MKIYKLIIGCCLLLLGAMHIVEAQMPGTPYIFRRTQTTVPTIVTTLSCSSATQAGTLTTGTAASGVTVTVPYIGGNGGGYTVINIASTGVTGLTANAAGGNVATGNGSIVFNITGTATAAGTASFALTLGGQSCSFTATVTSACVAPAITAQPQSATVTSPATNTFSVTATGSGLTYQWKNSAGNISGATASTYTTGVADTYSVVVTGTCGSPVTSSNAVLTVNAACVAPAITAQPQSATVTSPATNTFSVTATGSGLTYQWKNSAGSIAGATSSTYTTGVADTYSVVVTGTCGSPVTSSNAMLTVNAACVAPAITAQPQSVTVTSPATNTFSVTATGSGLTYQWKNSAGNISGATASTYTTGVADTYSVVVTGTCGSPVTSSNAVLTVCNPPVITAQPQSASVTSPATKVFSVTATGTGLTYQWKNGSGNINGATNSTYTTGTAGTYYVVVTGSCGTPVTSSNATLTVNVPACSTPTFITTTSCTSADGSTMTRFSMCDGYLYGSGNFTSVTYSQNGGAWHTAAVNGNDGNCAHAVPGFSGYGSITFYVTNSSPTNACTAAQSATFTNNCYYQPPL